MAGRRTIQSMRVGSRTLELSNLGKVLWPRDGYTKGDLIKFYVGVARWLLPYLKDRPLTLQRWPNGIGGQSFFEKNAGPGTPGWVKTVTVPAPESERRRVRYIVCNDVATLAYVANLAAITLHAWLSRRQSPASPDFALFDLDPGPGCPLRTLASVALRIRDALRRLGITSLVKTTGGDGLHVMFRLKSGHSYKEVRDFVELVSRSVASERPDDVTLERMTAKRKRGTVYIDYLQIGKGKTIVFPFVVRARPGAPVSFPLRWSQVEAMARSRSDGRDERKRWTMANVPDLLRKSGDPWRAGLSRAQSLAGAARRMTAKA